MQRLKSRLETLGCPYVTTTDIKRLIGCETGVARRVYAAARKIDVEQLGEAWMVHPHKVRTTTALQVLGLDYEQLRAMVLAAEGGNRA